MVSAFAAAILLCAAPLFAQAKKGEEPPAPKGYILQYTLTTLCVVLGVYVCCRPGRRGARSKMERAEEEK